MLHKNLVVFDIETIPDTNVIPNLTGFDDPNVDARRAELERYHLEITKGNNAFPRQPFHKVVAISVLRAEIERDGRGEAYYLQELRSGGTVKSSEEELVAGFFKYFQHHLPRLVTYNGRGFDLPVLKYRAMVHGVQAHLLHDKSNKWENYSQRYAADWHCDLIEVLSDFGASARCKMNEVCSVMGFPGKFGVDGSKVTEMYDGGDVEAIRNYCETDVLNTYLVYLRYQMHAGILSKEGYNRSIADVISLIEAEQGERPYLGEFMEAWGESCNNKFLLDD